MSQHRQPYGPQTHAPMRSVPNSHAPLYNQSIPANEPHITPAIASQVMKRVLSFQLMQEGFKSAEPAAMYRLELEVVYLMGQIFERAKEYAEHANRMFPTILDVVPAGEEYGMTMDDLIKAKRRSSRKRTQKNLYWKPQKFVSQRQATPLPDTLPSDEEGAPLVIPATLRSLPSHLPQLPPKHTYRRTTLPLPAKQAIPSLEKKLKNASLVQESLRNLLQATEDNLNQEDGELFGGTVNWEATRYPKKRWKVRG